MSCNNELGKHTLPIIKIKIAHIELEALLDTGANLSLIRPDVIQTLKEHIKIDYISRQVNIKTLDNQSIPYMSAVNMKFKIDKFWFSNVFFVTLNNWNSKYQAILGYDFINRNKLLIDSANNQIIMGNNKLLFDNISPIPAEPKIDYDNLDNELNTVRILNNITILPNECALVSLRIPSSMKNKTLFIFSPIKKNCNYLVQESIIEVKDNAESFLTIVENISSQNITLRKNSKLGHIEPFIQSIHQTEEQETYQINNLNLQEVTKLRKEELKENHFDLNHLNDIDRKEILDILMRNFSVFSSSFKTLGSTDEVVPEFKLIHNFPIQTKPYPIPKIAKAYAQEEIKKLLEAGIIEPSMSSYSFPVIFVKKKSSEKNPTNVKYRMVVDYRLLNSLTESYKICLPKISDIIQSISGKQYYTVLDLKSAFFQIKLKEEDKEKLAFSSELGNFHPCRLPQGAKNSTSYFHTLISKCLDSLKGNNVQFFLDDIIISSNSITEMKNLLQNVFDNLKRFNLTIDPAKTQICKSEITYLGFNLNSKGFSPSEENIKKVSKFPRPKNSKEVQSYLGMLNYFRHMIYKFAEIAKPIVDLTKKNKEFIWTTECQAAFDHFQDIMLNRPTLKNLEIEEKLYLATDASKIAVCGILMQKKEKKFYPVQFFSKQLSDAESRYPSIRREFFAIFLAVKHYHEYLLGRDFTILTDAETLTKHLHLDKMPDIVARWHLYLQDFSYDFQHIPGCNNPADYLSRVVEEENDNANSKNNDQCILKTNFESEENSNNINNLEINNIELFTVNKNLNYDEILKCQNEDTVCQSIIEKINEGQNNSNNKYFIDNHTKLLMVKVKPKGKRLQNKKIQNKIFIPKNLIKECIQEAHGPHFGVNKTFQFVKKKYSWNNLFLDVKNYVDNCKQCMQNKPKPENTLPQMISKSNLAPGEFISVDIVGKLPRSIDGKFFLLTIIDHYSRYFEAIPLHNTTSFTIIKALNNYFARFGLPKIILSDNGSYFISSIFKQFFKQLNIEHRFSSIYFPRSNGVCERTHRSLKQSIASMCNNTFEWSDRILYFKLHYNNSVHSVTQFTPAQLFFGRDLNLPMDNNHPPAMVENPSTYISKLKQHIIESKKLVCKNESEYFDKNTKYVKGRPIPQLEIDDEVYLKAFNKPGTFQKKYLGPYQIIKKFRNNNYLIRESNNDEARIIKVNASKLFKSPELRPNLQ